MWSLNFENYLKSDTAFIWIDGKSLLERGDGPAQELVNSLQVFEIAAASMDSALHPLVINMYSASSDKTSGLVK